MKQKTRRRISTATNAIVAIFIVLLLLGVVGFFAFFTNNFTSDFKTFYVKVRGETILNDKENYEVSVNDEYRFDVGYTFGFFNKDQKLGYRVKIKPNITEETKFDFTVNGEKYGYEGETDLTQGFDVKQYDDYFTLTATKDLPDILQALYPNKMLTDVPNAINSGQDYFMLLIYSEDETTRIAIKFELTMLRIILTPDKVIF